MKILIIPDVHSRKFWRKTISDNADKVEKIVFLGDYLDPYPDEIEENPELMECKDFYDSYSNLNMLNDIISLKKDKPNKYVLLTGNHSDSYIWSKFAAATRTDYKNWELYHKFFSENLNLFNLVWIEGNCIFSHAGISQGWAERVWKKLEYPADGLISIMEIAIMLRDTPLTEFTNDYINIISDISHYRGGDMFYGSCEWADLREHIEKIISYENNTFIGKGESGTFQVFGHTQLINKPLICDKWACLDCRKGFIINTSTHEISEC
jgi:predicted MPP superfamily phosphohydrolase